MTLPLRQEMDERVETLNLLFEVKEVCLDEMPTEEELQPCGDVPFIGSEPITEDDAREAVYSSASRKAYPYLHLVDSDDGFSSGTPAEMWQIALPGVLQVLTRMFQLMSSFLIFPYSFLSNHVGFLKKPVKSGTSMLDDLRTL